MEPESSLPHSQVHATCPYPKPTRSNPYPTSHFPKIHVSIILPSTPGSSNWSLSFRFPHQNPVYVFPLSPNVLHGPPKSLLSVLSPEQYWVSNTDHSAPHYVVLSIPLLPRPSYAQIFSSAPYSQTRSAFVPPSMWATKFHTHKNNRQNYTTTPI